MVKDVSEAESRLWSRPTASVMKSLEAHIFYTGTYHLKAEESLEISLLSTQTPVRMSES